jgi:hypothetical protein
VATELKGALKLRKALREFAPDLAKETVKEMGAALRPVVAKARGFLPPDGQVLSGWTGASASAETANYRAFPKYNQLEARRGVSYKTTPSKPNRSGFVALARIVNASAPGAIYETSGRKNPGGRPRGGETYRYGTRKDGSFLGGTGAVGKDNNQSLNPNAGKQFLENLNATGKLVNARPRQQGQVGRASRKMTGRVIYRAYSEDQGRANAAVIKAIENSADKFNKKTKAA